MRRTVALTVAGLLLTASLVACSDGEGGVTLPTRSPSAGLPSPTRSVTGGLPSPTRTGATEDTEEPAPTATESPEDTDQPAPTVTQTVTQTPEDTDEPEPSRTPTRQPQPSGQPPSESSEPSAESPPQSEPATEDTAAEDTATEDTATEDSAADDEATGEETSDDDTVPTWLWWLLAAVVVGLAIGIPLLLRSRRRSAWRQQLAEAEGELGWLARELLPGLRRAHSREEVAGGWAVASPRVTAAEDSLTALESTAYDDGGRDRARALRDASRLARQRMEQLLAPGPQDTWALDLDTIMADLEAALGPRTSPSA
jgi:hypothetical protein